MSTYYPPLMKFPKRGPTPIRLCDKQPPEPFDFIKRIECEGHEFLTIVSRHRDHQPFLENKVYYFSAAHLVIPKFFIKVDVDPYSGQVISESHAPLGREMNGVFAIGLREPLPAEDNKLWDKNALFKRGDHNCGLPTFSQVANNDRVTFRKKKKPYKKITPRFITNTHELFFRFHNHYFTPILLSNGTTCYHIFENKRKIKRWVKFFNKEKEYEIQINQQIRVNNILRVPITRKVWISNQRRNRI